MDAIEAVEQIDGDFDSRVVFTCEHASAELPEPWTWPGEDRWLVDTHWASDIGAAAFTRRVAQLMNAPAALSRFSRLLIDPNRPLDSDTLFRENAEGRTVHLNEALLEAERARRIDRFYLPYHAAVSAMVERSRGDTVFSIHTFTDNYEGEARALEIGVLFDHDEALARAVANQLEATGLRVALNEPYTGKGGLMYSASTHATRHGRRAVEIEVRQDLATDPGQHERLVGAIASAVAAVSAQPTG